MAPERSPEARRNQKQNASITEIKTMPSRGHASTIDSGWREVADTALACGQRYVKASTGHADSVTTAAADSDPGPDRLVTDLEPWVPPVKGMLRRGSLATAAGSGFRSLDCRGVLGRFRVGSGRLLGLFGSLRWRRLRWLV